MDSRIAIITNSLSLGGAERVSVLLTEWLHDNDKSVALFTLNRDREEGYVVKEGVRRIAINENSQNSKLSIIINLRNQIKRYKPTVILVMGVPLSVFVVPAVTFLGIPVIISERNDPSKFMGKYTTKLFSRLFMHLAQGYIFQTSNAKSYYSTGVQKKGKVIPNPLTTDNIPKPYEGLRKKKIVSVGRLVPQKNHEMLIKAFNDVLKSYPEYTLTIYGNGSEYNNLKDLIESLGINENVFLPGTTSNIYKQILDAQIFVLSSRFEGMPNALIEAMALGIPVISTNCPSGGPAELIEHKKNGYLVPENNIGRMSEAIKELIVDDELAKELGYNAVNIKNKLDKNSVCYQWLNYIEEIENR